MAINTKPKGKLVSVTTAKQQSTKKAPTKARAGKSTSSKTKGKNK